MIQQETIAKRQEETIRELQSLVTKLQKQLEEKTTTEPKPEEKKEVKKTKKSEAGTKIVSPSFKPITSSYIPRATKTSISKGVKPPSSALPTQAGKLNKNTKPASSGLKDSTSPATKSITEKTASKTAVINNDGAASNFSPPNLRNKASTKIQDGRTVKGK